MDKFQYADFNYLGTETDEDSSVGDIFKIVFIGDSGVGKTNIMNRFSKNIFNINSKPTIGVDFALKNVKLGPYSIRLQLWDTAGQERYKSFTSTYFKDAHGIIFVYDITNKESFQNISNWISIVGGHTDLNSNVKMLIGNKMDLTESRQVGTEEASDFANKHSMFFFETSALDNRDDHMGKVFFAVINGSLKRPRQEKSAVDRADNRRGQQKKVE
jgi:Rab family protein